MSFNCSAIIRCPSFTFFKLVILFFVFLFFSTCQFRLFISCTPLFFILTCFHTFLRLSSFRLVVQNLSFSPSYSSTWFDNEISFFAVTHSQPKLFHSFCSPPSTSHHPVSVIITPTTITAIICESCPYPPCLSFPFAKSRLPQSHHKHHAG